MSDIKFFGVVAIGFVMLLFGITQFNQYKCETKSQLMGYNFNFSFSTGCMIEISPKKYIPIESYREISDQK